MNLLSRFGGRLWDPWREIGQLQHEMGRLLNSARSVPVHEGHEGPPVNVYTNDNDILISLETLAGKLGGEGVEEGTGFHRRERPVGQFSRRLQLPFEVDPSKTEATYEQGVLSVKLSRPESAKPRRITVKAS